MTKAILLSVTLCICMIARSQNGFLDLKKGHKSIQHFWKDSHFTFQLKDGQWLTGIITGVTSDSFYFTQEIIRYYDLGSDTLHYGGLAFALTEVRALPTKNELIVYDHDKVKIILGHEKFVWVRNGFIFMAAGAAYAGVSIANDLATNDPPFAKENLPGLAVASGVILLGLFLHLNFDPYLQMGKKYHLEAVSLKNSSNAEGQAK